ncbi:Chronic lymphocytic leukemia deletion region gene 6 protein [Echinococcus granulosus]|uniref:SPRY domain-containing protein 7 n=2 Tax=Echinococcus granulosus TaxID=6210 RepID=W6UVN6_ECHGR|nr:Chronic lymphocytic leukemia deletion region gene 6 protein [Echinococcus granulosus]EUB57489.1 Chronic lymphocytic leukemia deletion region gene 6 protein [Echinococcus granulosus]
MSFPLVVKEFFIFTAQNKEAFGSEYGKVLYFYPSGTSQNDQLAVVGLCDALLSFSNFFLTSCTALHTRNGKRYFHRISDDVWGVLSVSVIDPSALSHVCKFCERIIDDNVISHKLANLCERFESSRDLTSFQLLHGPILIGSEAEMVESRSNLMKFFSKELTMIDLSFHDIPDLFEAIQGKFWSPKNILSLENLGTRIQLSCPFPNTSAVLLYDAHLAWSSLSVKDFRPILRYIISEIMSLPPDLDLAAISPKAPHMGRFLTGPPDMDKRLCPAQTLIPTVFLKLPNSEYRRVNVVVYRALRLTFCLFVDEKYALKKEFFTTFDTMYGNALTDLSTEIEGDYGESAAFTSDISTLSLSTESSSKPIQGTPGCSSIGGFLLWEPELASITTDLFPLYSGGLSDVIPAFAPLLPIIYAVRGDVMSCFGQSWCECLVKLEPDIWLHLRRLNKREIFLTFFGKKVDISKVINVMAFIYRRIIRCCIRPRGRDSIHWDRVGLYSDEEDERETAVLMPLYTFAQPQPQTAVKLDLASAGQFAVIVKNNTRLCGSGAARASAPIVQDKAYFEVKLQSGGLWAIGLCHSKANLNVADDMRRQNTAWVLFHDGVIYHDSVPLMELESRKGTSPALEEGDILGVFYDHTELRFAINGVPQYFRDHGRRCTGVTGIRGAVYPLLAADEGAVLDVRFTCFQYPPREGGYTEIRLEQNIL